MKEVTLHLDEHGHPWYTMPMSPKNGCSICGGAHLTNYCHKNPITQTKSCIKCNKELPKTKDFFYSNSRTRDRLQCSCKTCAHEYARTYYHKTKHDGKHRERTKTYHTKILSDPQKKKLWYEKHKLRMRIQNRAIRLEVIRHYSNGLCVCACCGEKTFEFLAVDHLNGGGLKHRKIYEIKSLANWLFRNGFPGGFQILCYNCNQAKALWGACPHKSGKSALDILYDTKGYSRETSHHNS